MSSKPYDRSASRYRSSSFDEDDDGEPFEQDPPPGFFQKPARVAVSSDRPVPTPVLASASVATSTSSPKSISDTGVPSWPAARAKGEGALVDNYVRSSETRAGRYGRQSRSQPRSARDAVEAPLDEVASRSSSLSASASAKPKRSLRGRALAYLSRREHSRDELARKLAPFVEPTDGDDPVPAVLDRLAEEGWLSDARFAQSVVNRRAARFGAMRIVGELKRHKVDSDTVQTLSENLRDTEWDRISAVWSRKFGTLATTQQERAKQGRFLASRGFSRDAIMRIIKAGDDDMLGEE